LILPLQFAGCRVQCQDAIGKEIFALSEASVEVVGGRPGCGEYQAALKVRLAAPPIEDRANDALRRLLAARLNVPVSAVRIVGGEKSRNKRVSVAGITRAQVAALTVAAKTKRG